MFPCMYSDLHSSIKIKVQTNVLCVNYWMCYFDWFPSPRVGIKYRVCKDITYYTVYTYTMYTNRSREHAQLEQNGNFHIVVINKRCMK